MEATEAPFPVGTRVAVKPVKNAHKSDRKFHGMAGTVVGHAQHPSRFDHIVRLDDWDMNRWFSVDELERKEG